MVDTATLTLEINSKPVATAAVDLQRLIEKNAKGSGAFPMHFADMARTRQGRIACSRTRGF